MATRHSIAIAAVSLAALFPVATAFAQSKTYELNDSGWQAKKTPEPGTDAAIIAQARQLVADDKASDAIELLDGWIETHETSKSPMLPEAFLVRGDAHLADSDEYKALYDYERIAKDYPASDMFVKALERELDIAKLYLGGLRKKSLGFLRIDSGIPLAEEAIMRINERLPGSRLAERAMLTLAD
jgi:hypothetical protein